MYLTSLALGAALAAWPSSAEPALDGPLAGLAWKQSPEAAWAALPPPMRPSFDLKLEPGAFDTFVAAHPELLEMPDRYEGGGGNRWRRYKATDGTWPEVDGVRWRVEIDEHGLSRVMVRFPADVGMKALEAAWGPPDTDARWKIWYGDGLRAAYTGCFKDHCTVELMPYAPVEAVVKELLLPGGGTWIGRTLSSLPPGIQAGERTRLVHMTPTHCSSGYVPIELTWNESDTVVGLRTQLDWTYDAAAKQRITQALSDALGPAEVDGQGCLTWPAAKAKACVSYSHYRVEVGDP